jgi:flavin reductase (DIM6/NTAB) family NADH-FMN oxidoreductase RutF
MAEVGFVMRMQLNLAELSAGQRYFVLSSLVVPRPIAWVTTLNEDGGVNAAPFSYFQLLGQEPPLIVLGIGRRNDGSAKDSFRNIRRAKEFVINLVTEENAEQMNWSATEFPAGVSEPEALGLRTEPSVMVKPPRLAVAPAQLEGRELQTLLIGQNQVVMGELLTAHIRDEFIDAESLRVKTEEMHLIGRLQGGEGGGYCRTREPFHLKRLTYAEWQELEGKRRAKNQERGT